MNSSAAQREALWRRFQLQPPELNGIAAMRTARGLRGGDFGSFRPWLCTAQALVRLGSGCAAASRVGTSSIGSPDLAVGDYRLSGSRQS